MDAVWGRFEGIRESALLGCVWRFFAKLVGISIKQSFGGKYCLLESSDQILFRSLNALSRLGLIQAIVGLTG